MVPDSLWLEDFPEPNLPFLLGLVLFSLVYFVCDYCLVGWLDFTLKNTASLLVFEDFISTLHVF